jgi:hypothetical protein
MNTGHDDYAVEPIRGLPEKLPAGEHILWQGAPRWRALAQSVFHIRAVAVYFSGLMLWRSSVHWHQGVTASAAAALSLLPIALVGLGLLALLAWLCSRTTVYTITNRRVVLRIGVALPTAINIPFNAIGGAKLGLHSKGAGDIPLALIGEQRMAYSNLWPHVRPWRLANPEPMFRSIPDAQRVAQVLSAALVAALPGGSIEIATVEADQQTRSIRPEMAHANAA